MLTQLLIDFINGEEIGYQTLAQLNKFERYIKGLIRPGYVARFHENYNRTMESEVYGIQIFEEEISTNDDIREQKYKTTKPWYMDYMEFSINSLGLQIFKCKLCSLKVRHETLDLYMQHIQSTHNQVVEEQLRRNQDEEFSNETHQINMKKMCSNLLIDFINSEEIGNHTLEQVEKVDLYIKGLICPEDIAKSREECRRIIESEKYEYNGELDGKQISQEEFTTNLDNIEHNQTNIEPWFMDHIEISYNSSGLQIYICKLCSKSVSSENVTYENIDLFRQHIQNKHDQLIKEHQSEKLLNKDGKQLSAGEFVKRKKYRCKNLPKNMGEVFACNDKTAELNNADSSLNSGISLLHATDPEETSLMLPKVISKPPNSCMPRSPSQSDLIKKKKKRTSGQCDVCNRSFNDLYNLRIHKMIHTDEKPFQCETCGKRFRQYNKLKIHCITHTNLKPYTCNICNKGFRFRNYLSVHKRLHSTDKPYKCKFCDELFHSLHSRRLHAKMMHCEAKTFNCPICSKILTAQCYLTAHMKRHTNQRDYKCSTCDKCFFSQSQLKDHQLVHTNLKPYKCEVCNACFQRKSNYTQHSKIHTGEKSYICHICKKSFAQNAGLYGHMKSHARS